MTYDLVHTSMHVGTSISSISNSQRSLLVVTNHLPHVIADRHPCQHGRFVISGAQWMGQLFFQLAYSSTHFAAYDLRICGLFHVTYIPGSNNVATGPLSHPAEKPLILSWKVRTNGSFAINLTISELEAPSSYGCEDARLEVQVVDYRYIHRALTCPNWPPAHFMGTDITLKMFLNYHRRTTASKNGKEKYLTTILLQYQILDSTNFSLKWNHPASPLAILPKEYTLRVDSNNILPNMKNSPVVFVGALPRALIYIFAFATKGYFTPVVVRKNVSCNDHEAEIIFYDGHSEIFLQQFQPILKLWNCAGNAGNHDTEEVRGSIGVLSTAVFVPIVDRNKSFSIVITWQAQRILPSVFRQRRIELTLSQNRTIHLFPKQGTALEVVRIVAPEGKFVRLWFSHIKYVPTRHLFMYGSMCMDGIDIKDPLRAHILGGLICSNSTAENIVRQSKTAGLTVGGNVTITLRQYWWMASISATITANADRCVGYINLLPVPRQFFSTIRLPEGIVNYDRT